MYDAVSRHVHRIKRKQKKRRESHKSEVSVRNRKTIEKQLRGGGAKYLISWDFWKIFVYLFEVCRGRNSDKTLRIFRRSLYDEHVIKLDVPWNIYSIRFRIPSHSQEECFYIRIGIFHVSKSKKVSCWKFSVVFVEKRKRETHGNGRRSEMWEDYFIKRRFPFGKAWINTRGNIDRSVFVARTHGEKKSQVVPRKRRRGNAGGRRRGGHFSRPCPSGAVVFSRENSLRRNTKGFVRGDPAKIAATRLIGRGLIR